MPSTIWHWKLPFSHFAIEITSLAYDDGFCFISASTHHSDGIIITDYITSRAWQHDGRFKGFKAAYFQFFWVNSSHHKSCEFISHQWSSVVDLLLKSPHSTKSLLASQKDVVYFISFGFLPYIALMRHYFIGPSFARLKITNCLTPRAWQHRSSLFGLAFYRCNRFCNHFENCRNRLASIWTCIKVGFLYYWRWDSQCQQEPPRDQQPNSNQHLASRPSGSSTPTERSSLNGDSLQKFQSADLAEINYLVTYCQKLPHIESSTASRAFSPIQSHTLSLHEAVWMGVLTQNTPHISNEGSDLTHSCATAGGTQRFIAALH